MIAAGFTKDDIPNKEAKAKAKKTFKKKMKEGKTTEEALEASK